MAKDFFPRGLGSPEGIWKTPDRFLLGGIFRSAFSFVFHCHRLPFRLYRRRGSIDCLMFNRRLVKEGTEKLHDKSAVPFQHGAQSACKKTNRVLAFSF